MPSLVDGRNNNTGHVNEDDDATDISDHVDSGNNDEDEDVSHVNDHVDAQPRRQRDDDASHINGHVNSRRVDVDAQLHQWGG